MRRAALISTVVLTALLLLSALSPESPQVQASPTQEADLIGDKDGFGFGLMEGDARDGLAFFDNREPDDPPFTDTLPVPVVEFAFTYEHTYDLPNLPIISAQLEIFTLGVQDGDSDVLGNDTDITLSIDGLDVPGAFDAVDQWVGGKEIAGLVSISIPEGHFPLLVDGSAHIRIETLQLGTSNSHDAYAIDYSELVIQLGDMPILTQGDNDCDGDVDAVDALTGLRHIAALDVNQQLDCPELGAALPAAVPAGDPPNLFGDIDCDDDLDAVDQLKILRSVAALPVSQSEPCTNLGEPF